MVIANSVDQVSTCLPPRIFVGFRLGFSGDRQEQGMSKVYVYHLRTFSE
jgi:hypothetical protein